MTNPILDQLNNHRSIRQFTDVALTDTEISTLVDAAQHAPTSTFSQQYSIISVTDAETIQALASITGHAWMKNSGHYFIMVADQYRNLQITKSAGRDTALLHSTDKFLASVFDAAIATENIVVAAESLGLGSTIMGSILNNAGKVIALLNLPELTFPLLGIAVGHPAGMPDLKPRMPQSMMHFTDTYNLPDDFAAQLTAYDDELTAYYQQRDSHTKQENFSHHLARELSRDLNVRADLATLVKQQGFKLE
ncbi:NADPH-dependent oxidoreductase [Secundilactobacillus paracollinoides]|uniref:NADPH-dependent oxidoreductase n=1 Tax=Secundilactobacillus paracollinoides TaxID=240427 RepID=A0A1B2IWD3_9LACO|nr:NADPH-dependent oxidoreductase [Secundilactobacillus paracollinoides]ANZ60525.1 NADPH-dependent oxidoreductase [Secundilactobacillus paracollinoides]ANZ64837.1 NADPH-dependent oxidoreductase [Secundilactobacillus paracollinoides]ANZ66352.1 NADPH-dependent oxidoreductase [Secundilactobacillus paracollinoides]KRL79678.1 nitroreductase [Secundilactobacillus paracollinoides DSM 15502 = JCM 11969]